MSTLHTLNQSPLSTAIWDRLCRTMQPGDSLLLIENGVYYLNHAQLDAMLAHPNAKQVFALNNDATARGMQLDHNCGVSLIDYTRFVALSCEHDKVIAWY